MKVNFETSKCKYGYLDPEKREVGLTFSDWADNSAPGAAAGQMISA